MRTRVFWQVGLVLALVCIGAPAQARPLGGDGPQIPTLQSCNPTRVTGIAQVHVDGRGGGGFTGNFGVRVNLTCDPLAGGYPVGGLAIFGISMVDSSISGLVQAVAPEIEHLSSTGKYSPTAYLSGRCRASGVVGCHFWLLIADNDHVTGPGTPTPDVVSFLVFDGSGNRVAYGTGPALSSTIRVN